MQLQPT